MLLTIYRECANIQTVREQHTPKQPEGPEEERSGRAARTLARGNAPGGPTLPTKTDQRRRGSEISPGAERLTVEQWDALKVENKTV